jgi:hypothetical protein
MASLGEQEAARRVLTPAVRERWVLVPAGLGLAAAIIAANQVLNREVEEPGSGPAMVAAHANGDVLVNGVAGAKFGPGDRVEARSQAWLTVGDGAGVGLEAGSIVRFLPGTQVNTFALERGSATFASGTAPLRVSGATWSASLRQGSVASFALLTAGVTITVQEGDVEFQGLGQAPRLTPGDPYVFAGELPATEKEAPVAPSAPPPVAAVATGPGTGGEPQASPPQQGGNPNPPGNSAGGNSGQEPSPPGNNAGGNGNGQGNPNPPGNNAGGNSGEEPSPPGNNAGGNGNGQGNPNPPGNNAGGSSGQEPSPPGTSAGGNGNGQGNPNPPGNNAGGNGNGKGNPNPPANNAGGGPKKP